MSSDVLAPETDLSVSGVWPLDLERGEALDVPLPKPEVSSEARSASS